MSVDFHVVDPATGAHIDYETYSIVRHDAAGWSAALRAWVSIRRKMGERFTVYNVWRLIGVRNPAKQDAGRTGGLTAGHNMTAQQRINRAHLGGLAAFYRGASASSYGKLLADKKRRRRERGRLGR